MPEPFDDSSEVRSGYMPARPPPQRPESVADQPWSRIDRSTLGYSAEEAAARLALLPWKFTRAQFLELIPGPDLDDRWSSGLLDQIRQRRAEILAAVGTRPPIGRFKTAARINQLLMINATAEDVDELFNRGLLDSAGQFRGNTLYDPREIDALCAHHHDTLEQIVWHRGQVKAEKEQADKPTWEAVRAKIVDRIDIGHPPGINRLDAWTMVERLMDCGVVPSPRPPGRGAAAYEHLRNGFDHQGPPPHVGDLCRMLLDSVERRFAANLTRRHAEILLEVIDKFGDPAPPNWTPA